MSAKVGDTVRFLNATGGGKIVRIEGQVAYVDEDGFETPMLVRECVVVASGDTFYKSELRASKEKEKSVEEVPAEIKKASPPKPELPPIVETPEGEKLNLLLAFEPADIKRLSQTTFDAYFVNDSNYYLFATIATCDEAEKWTLRYHGLIEPAIQEFVFELTTEDLPFINRISVQAIAFKTAADFTRKNTVDYNRRIDATKFARLHCFDVNPYFDSKVLALEIVKNDEQFKPMKVNGPQLQESLKEKKKTDTLPKRIEKSSKPAQKRPDIIEIDLHAGELLDTLRGLSKADILNYQIDTFRKVMDENLRNIGQKIVFIHGKGEGVLRNAIMKELNYRYKGHEVADASFREYGFGATQVTIRRINQQK